MHSSSDPSLLQELCLDEDATLPTVEGCLQAGKQNNMWALSWHSQTASFPSLQQHDAFHISSIYCTPERFLCTTLLLLSRPVLFSCILQAYSKINSRNQKNIENDILFSIENYSLYSMVWTNWLCLSCYFVFRISVFLILTSYTAWQKNYNNMVKSG